LRAAKLVSAPRPFNKPPRAANAIRDGFRERQSRSNDMANAAETAQTATQNQTNDISNEMLSGAQLLRDPVTPKKTSVMTESQNQACILNTQKTNGAQCQHNTHGLRSINRFLKKHKREDNSDERS
jgi:hypothetical protein